MNVCVCMHVCVFMIGGQKINLNVKIVKYQQHLWNSFVPSAPKHNALGSNNILAANFCLQVIN